jgi:hypothetical protein
MTMLLVKYVVALTVAITLIDLLSNNGGPGWNRTN